MSLSGSGSLISRRNVKLDSFLQRSMGRSVHERVRASEPCVVISDAFNKVYMHAVLSDERVYLTEHAPRTLTVAVSFRRVRGIELVNDLPYFLSGRDREHCQHIRILYVSDEPATGPFDWRGQGGGTASRSHALSQDQSPANEDTPLRSDWRKEEVLTLKPGPSASCPNPEPRPPAQPPPHPPSPSAQRLETLQSPQVWRRTGSALSRLLRRDGVGGGARREAELHLYAVSQTSRLYLHLQSAWSSFIIRSTLLLDLLYRRKCSSSPGKRRPVISLSTVVVDTLSVVFRETQAEAARLNLLSARNGALTSRILLALLCDPLTQSRDSPTDSQVSGSLFPGTLTVDHELTVVVSGLDQVRVLLSEYLDAACSLLFELLLLGQQATGTTECLRSSGCFSADGVLSVDWLLRVAQPHPHLLPFITHQAQQVVLVLSDLQVPALSPVQAVLLFQRCRLLLACLQHSSLLARHLHSHVREEFRYLVKTPCAAEKLPPRYPISGQTLREVELLLTLLG